MAKALPLATAQDHKRVFDGDHRSEYRRHGAYSPAPLVTPAVRRRIMLERIIEPTVRAWRSGHAVQGVLYAGLMLD